MSTGARLPLDWARDAAKALMVLWQMPTDTCMVVGSVRRQKPDVGDLEFVAPLPVDKSRDELYRRMNPTLKADGLFAEATRTTYGVVLEGFKPGFKSCSLRMTLTRDGKAFDIPVQINRYAHDQSNRGWTEIRCTGPAEFGQAFLARWKKQHAIPPDKQASIDGFLVNGYGDRVSVPTEAIAFELCGMQWIDPAKREAMVSERMQGGRA